MAETKVCIKCLESKALDEFYHCRSTVDHRRGECKRCFNREGMERAAKRKDEVLAYLREWRQRPHVKEKSKVYLSAYVKEHRAERSEYHREYYKNNPEKRLAHQAVNNGLRKGSVVKSPCAVCGITKVEAHHEDYSKPLDIIWLCSGHHKAADKLRREKEN